MMVRDVLPLMSVSVKVALGRLSRRPASIPPAVPLTVEAESRIRVIGGYRVPQWDPPLIEGRCSVHFLA
jgi:hypothetical protein